MMVTALSDAHRSLADLVDALEEMNVDVEDSNVDYADVETTEVTIEATLPERPIVHEENIETEERLEEAREERDELQDRVDELETQLTNRQERAKELTIQRNDLRERVEEKDQLIEELQLSIADLEDERDTAIEQVDQLESQLVENGDTDQARDEFLGDGPAADELPEPEELFAINDEVADGETSDDGRQVIVHSNEDVPLTTFHEDPNCRYVEKIDDPEEVPLSELDDDVEPCGNCEGGLDDDSPDLLGEDELREAYEEHDGVVARVAEEFEPGYSTVYKRLRDLGVHKAVSDAGDVEEAAESEGDHDQDYRGGEEVLVVPGHSASSFHVSEACPYVSDDAELEPRDEIEELTPCGFCTAVGFDPDGGKDAFPRECGRCDETIQHTLEWEVHRTEVHEAPQSGLDNLDPGEFAEIVERSDSVNDLAGEFSWTTERTLRLLGVYGLADVVGGDVELSDVNDVDFDGVDETEGPDDSESDGQSRVGSTARGRNMAARICERHDIRREDVVEAVADAQAVFQVRRDLGLPADVTDNLLEGVGVLDDLERGGHIDRDRVERVVKEQVPPPAAADGGDSR